MRDAFFCNIHGHNIANALCRKKLALSGSAFTFGADSWSKASSLFLIFGSRLEKHNCPPGTYLKDHEKPEQLNAPEILPTNCHSSSSNYILQNAGTNSVLQSNHWSCSQR